MTGCDVRGIAVDAGHLYWASEAKGTIGRIALADFTEPFGTAKRSPAAKQNSSKTRASRGPRHSTPPTSTGRPTANRSPTPATTSTATIAGTGRADRRRSRLERRRTAPKSSASSAPPRTAPTSTSPPTATSTKRVRPSRGTARDRRLDLGSNFTGTCNLYLAHAGTIQLIARLDASGRRETQRRAQLDAPRGSGRQPRLRRKDLAGQRPTA